MLRTASNVILRTQGDSTLAALSAGGNDAAFEALVQRHRRALLAYCRRLLLPETRAEDALQQALLAAWNALQAGAEVANPKAWLYRIVHNHAIDALRVSGYDFAELHESLRGGGLPDEELDRRTAVREALAGLAALPPLQREVVLRAAVDGDSYERVATDLGMTEGAVRGLLFRARGTMRAGVSAVLPAPLISWAARTAAAGLAPQASDTIAAGGGLTAAGVLAKAGAVLAVATVGVGGGTVALHDHATARATRAAPVATPRPATPRGTASHARTPVAAASTLVPAAATALNRHTVALSTMSVRPTSASGGQHGGRTSTPLPISGHHADDQQPDGSSSGESREPAVTATAGSARRPTSGDSNSGGGSSSDNSGSDDNSGSSSAGSTSRPVTIAGDSSGGGRLPSSVKDSGGPAATEAEGSGSPGAPNSGPGSSGKGSDDAPSSPETDALTTPGPAVVPAAPTDSGHGTSASGEDP